MPIARQSLDRAEAQIWVQSAHGHRWKCAFYLLEAAGFEAWLVVLSGAESAVWSISQAPLPYCRTLALWWHSVTGRRLTVGFPLNRWDPQLAQPPPSVSARPGGARSPLPPIHRTRHDPARLHRSRTARPRRVPGRIPRPDPRRLRTGPAPVHQLVPGPLPQPVRRPPSRHRMLRPRPENQGPRPRHRHPAAVHHRRVLQIRRRRRTPGSLTRRPRPPSASRLRIPRRRT